MASRKEKITSIRLETELWRGLQAVKERDGVPVGEQVRRAVGIWLLSKDVNIGTMRGERPGRAHQPPSG